MKQLIDRVISFICNYGENHGYFNKENSDIFANELRYGLIHQMFSFNSPVWFNAGLYQTYNVNNKSTFPNFYWSAKNKEVVECKDEKRPYVSFTT